jgi:hypothetical protein
LKLILDKILVLEIKLYQLVLYQLV